MPSPAPLICTSAAGVVPAALGAEPSPGVSQRREADAYAPFPCQVASDADLWFAERTADVERAKALCRSCPIVTACLAGAVERAEPWGVWGGEVFVDGVVVATKRGRGRPRRTPAPAGDAPVSELGDRPGLDGSGLRTESAA